MGPEENSTTLSAKLGIPISWTAKCAWQDWKTLLAFETGTCLVAGAEEQQRHHALQSLHC